MKILSIASGAGWFARYKLDDGTIEEYPIVCWALGEGAVMKGESDVVGMIYDLEINLVVRCDKDDNFLGYRHESEPSSGT
jgi:hypothetical protein